MKRKMGIRWHLRELMAARGMWKTTDLVGPLAERGVVLSREQVYRLVTAQPERLNMAVLAALCDILGCSPNDLIEPVAEARTVRKKAAGATPAGSPAKDLPLRPVRARIVDGPTRPAP
ncbi:MAG: helix-turn-helix transcriptional regulator [Ilumatobacteraceae bacterium]